jgi:hypothetical protein
MLELFLKKKKKKGRIAFSRKISSADIGTAQARLQLFVNSFRR